MNLKNWSGISKSWSNVSKVLLINNWLTIRKRNQFETWDCFLASSYLSISMARPFSSAIKPVRSTGKP